METKYVLVAVLALSLSVVHGSCPLPGNADIVEGLEGLLLNADGAQSYRVSLLSPIRYVCQAVGNWIDTFASVSVIVTYTPNPGAHIRTSIFQLWCNYEAVWEADASGGLPVPSSSITASTPTRTDCAQCRHNWGDDRCRPCPSNCDTGMRRCTGIFSTDCCLIYTTNGLCSNARDCASLYNSNYVATASNNYICTCNITCPAGYAVSNNCDRCIFTSICDRDSPCHNGGNCIQYSPATNYTCNCTGTGYEGFNCTVCSLHCSAGYTLNSSSCECIFTSICDRDRPCKNGGNCIQRSPATNYTCDCTGTGYEGFNCTVCSLHCSAGYTLNSSSCECIFTSICDRDRPCKNGGNCIQHSPATNYTCDCTGTGYEGVNCTDPLPSPSPSPSPTPASCTLPGCERCDGCCQTCLPGYMLSDDDCTCICSLSCSRGYSPSSNCTDCVLTNICEASNPCGNANCSVGSQPNEYTCYYDSGLSALSAAIATVFSVVAIACIVVIIIFIVVFIKTRQRKRQSVVVPLTSESDPVTQANLVYDTDN